VEQDPKEIFHFQLKAIRDAIKVAKISVKDVVAIGVTNQRETTILWNKRIGEPVYNAIVWRCRRIAEYVEKIKEEYYDVIKEKTGLVPDSYFSAPKIKWILDNVPGIAEKAKKGEILFGTLDTYLIWRLSGGKNVSRTMLFNIKKA